VDRQSRQEWTTSQRYHFHRNHRFDLALHYPSFLGRFHFPRFLWRCTYYRCLRSHSRFEVSRVYSTLFVIVPLTILHFSSGSSSLEVISPTPSGRTVDSLFPSVLSLASGTVSSNPFSLISGKHKLNFGVSFLSSLPPRRPLLSSRIPRQRRELQFRLCHLWIRHYLGNRFVLCHPRRTLVSEPTNRCDPRSYQLTYRSQGSTQRWKRFGGDYT